MSASSESQYRSLIQEIQRHSPKTSIWLEQIYQAYGTQAGCYASVAIVWLHARVESFGARVLVDLSDQDVHTFTYFQEMQEKPEAIALFRTMLETYIGEQLAYDSA